MKKLRVLYILAGSLSAVWSQNTTFQSTRFQLGCRPASVVTGDFNGDQNVDLAYGCSATDPAPIVILLGKGDGTFGSPIQVPGPAIGTAAGNKVLAGEFNRDGKSDLAYFTASGSVIILLSDGDGTFSSSTISPPAGTVALGAVADLTSNGSADLVFLLRSPDNLAAYIISNGDGTFGRPNFLPVDDFTRAADLGFLPTSAYILDINRDGKLDIVLGVKSQRTISTNGVVQLATEIVVALGQNGTFSKPEAHGLWGSAQMAFGDFDGDGSVDAAGNGQDSFAYSSLYIAFKVLNGDLLDVKSSSYPSGRNPLQAADLNGDGRPEVIFGSQALNDILILTADGLPKDQPSGFIDLGTTPVDLAVADLNNDGKLDVVSANINSTTILINTTVFPPKVTGVLNGASFAAGQAIAPGSLASIFGSGLATSNSQAATVPLPMSLANVAVTVGGVPAALLYVSAMQINFQVPWSVSPGPADIVVTVKGTALPALKATIAAIAPGVFSVASGTGTAIAINSDGSLGAPVGSIPGIATHPSKPGDTIIVLATGLGAVIPSIETGAASLDMLRKTVVTPNVLIGGANAQVSFSGLSPQFVGVNQLNVVVPQISDGVVPLQLEVGASRSTDKVTIAVQN